MREGIRRPPVSGSSYEARRRGLAGAVLALLLLARSLAGASPAEPVVGAEDEGVPPWKGERVVLVARDESSYGMPSSTSLRGELVGRKAGEIELGRAYDRKTGVVVEVRPGRTRSDARAIVALDGSEERVALSERFIGFASEMASLEAVIGRSVWTRGRLDIRRGAGKFQKLLPLSALKPIRAAWSAGFDILELTVTAEDGGEGSVGFGWSRCVQRRLHPSAVCKADWSSDDFFLEDPRAAHKDWSPATWEALAKGRLLPGMTEEQVRVVCGTEMREIGAEIDASGRAVTVFRCTAYDMWKVYFESGKAIKIEYPG